MLHNLSSWDDYAIHQASTPVLQPVTGDPNAYDRYFFHGYDASGMIFVVAVGVYPNRGIIDASLCVSRDGVQRSVFSSGRLGDERRTLDVGAFTLEVVEPLDRLRVRVMAPDHGLSADLTFIARTVPLLEPRQTMLDRARLVMDTCRFAQFGRWEGALTVDGEVIQIRPDDVAGTRDRSWGVRPLSGATPQSPSPEVAGIWWLWAPLQFDDGCVHVALAEDARGVPTVRGMALLDSLGRRTVAQAGDASVEHARDVRADVEWEPGTRRARRARVTLDRVGGNPPLTCALEPIGRVFLRGAGYLNFEWPHGGWKDEVAVGGEVLRHADLDPGDFQSLHVQQVVKVTASDGREGIGVLEQLCIGPHEPSGFIEFADLA